MIRIVLTLLVLLRVSSHAETWMGLVIAPEDRCSEYNRDRYGRYSQSLEPEILERMGGEIRCRYTGQVYDSLLDTDIEHVVAISEAHDSGLCAADAETRRAFVSDLDNLTLADPQVNRYKKGAKDAAEWLPELNRLWFVETVIEVKKKYGLSIDRAEMEALRAVLRDRLPEGPDFTEVVATVLGGAVEGLTVDFSRAVAGHSPDYVWGGVTDAAGQVSLTISGGRVSGFYRARAMNADGEVVGWWHSIPLNLGRRQVLELTLGGGMWVLASEHLPAARQAAASEEPLVSGLGANAPNPFNSTTLIPYRLAQPGWTRMVIYNALGQQVRTLVNEFQAAGLYQVHWDARDQQGFEVAAGVYVTHLQYPGGVQTGRLLYLR